MKANTVKSATHLRGVLLSEAEDIIHQLVCKAKGIPGPLENGYGNVAEEKQILIWNAIVPMMQQAGDLQKVSASTSAEIIGLLKEGTISFAEAKELMSIISMKFEIEELSALRDKLNEATASSRA